jgi:PhoPQ-activated pathogenicity-related protein
MENTTCGLFSILIVYIIVLIGLSSVTTIVPASIPVTVQAANISLLQLQEINQIYGNNQLIQIAIYHAQGNTTAIVNWQISEITQVVNKLSYIFDLFHKLSLIKDYLEIFIIPLILIIIIYIYKQIK